MKRILLNIVTAVVALWIIWVALSFFDVVADNNTTAEHSPYNFFNIMLDREG